MWHGGCLIVLEESYVLRLGEEEEMKRIILPVIVVLCVSCAKLQLPFNSKVGSDNPPSGDDHSGQNDDGSSSDDSKNKSGDNTNLPGVAAVKFTFVSGLAMNAPYNTKENPIVVKVGQSIEFTNNTGSTVRIHCNNPGRTGPMKHWEPNLTDVDYPSLATSQLRSYKIFGELHDPASMEDSRCYNHDPARNNPLYIKVIP